MKIQEFTSKSISSTSSLYFYNCGSAPARPEIEFEIDISNAITEKGYISLPSNSYASTTTEQYDCLYVDDVEAFRFTTPPSFSAYNTAIDILYQYSAGDSILELRKQLIEEVNHYYVRAWVCAQVEAILNDSSRTYCSTEGKLLDGFQTEMKTMFSKFISGTPSFYFNSKTGQATMTATYTTATSDFSYSNQSATSTTKISENCGSMALSKFLELSGGNQYTSDGTISYNQCGKLTSSIPLTITKFNFQYRYL